MAPRFCKKCGEAFHGATCAAGHPIYLYSKTIPDGVEVPAASPTPDDDDEGGASPLKPAVHGGADRAKKSAEPAASVDLTTVDSGQKAKQREFDRAIALDRTQERMLAALAKKQEPMMVAIDALKSAVAEDSRYKKAPDKEKPEAVLLVIASYRFAIGLAEEVVQAPKAKASVKKQLSEKMESMKNRMAKLEATLEDGAEEALAEALEKVRAATEKDNSEKVDAAVGKRMEAWDTRWEEEWVQAHAGGRRGALPGGESTGLEMTAVDDGEEGEEGFRSVPTTHSAAARDAENSLRPPPEEPEETEIAAVTEGLRDVAAPADVTGDPVDPPPAVRAAEASLGPPPSMPPPTLPAAAGTGDLLSAAADALSTAEAQNWPAEAVLPPLGAPPSLAASAPRPKMVIAAPRPRAQRPIPAPYTPTPAASGSLYSVGDSRRYLEASGTLAALSDALYALAAEPEATRPATEDGAAFIAEKAAAGQAEPPPVVVPTLTSEVNLVDLVCFDYLSGMAPAVHAALLGLDKARPTSGEAPGVTLGKILSPRVEEKIVRQALDIDTLRVELSGLKLGPLRERAAAAGCGASEIEDARDGDDPKSEIIALILEQAAPAVAQPLGPPPATPPATPPAAVAADGCESNEDV